MENNGKRVFLTGASGFIASYILSLLIEVGPSIRAKYITYQLEAMRSEGITPQPACDQNQRLNRF